MTRAPRSLFARGERVWVRTVSRTDLPPYERAVRGSWDRVGQWNPVSVGDLEWHLQRQSTDHRTFLIHANEPVGDHDLVGKVNVSNVIRGRFQNGTMGYDAYDPYAGRGLFAEGLRLIVGLAFAGESEGMGLHRVEANVRPGNTRSAGVLRSLGFRREGHVRSMLLLESGQQPASWRDHDAYAVHRDEWPAAPYAAHRPARTVALVGSARDPGAYPALAGAVANELGVPVFSTALVSWDTAWALLAASPVGGIIEGDWQTEPAESVGAGLERAGFDPRVVPRVHADGRIEQEPVGPSAPVDTNTVTLRDDLLQARDVSRIALEVRAAFA